MLVMYSVFICLLIGTYKLLLNVDMEHRVIHSIKALGRLVCTVIVYRFLHRMYSE